MKNNDLKNGDIVVWKEQGYCCFGTIDHLCKKKACIWPEKPFVGGNYIDIWSGWGEEKMVLYKSYDKINKITKENYELVKKFFVDTHEKKMSMLKKLDNVNLAIDTLETENIPIPEGLLGAKDYYESELKRIPKAIQDIKTVILPKENVKKSNKPIIVDGFIKGKKMMICPHQGWNEPNFDCKYQFPAGDDAFLICTYEHCLKLKKCKHDEDIKNNKN